MKRCPTCGNTYTNDALIFCLEDGATLVGLSGSQPGFDPQATLRVSQDDLPPPTNFKAQGAQTYSQPSPPLTAPPRTAPRTSDNQAPAAAAPASRPTSPVLVAGMTAIAVLLLVVSGIGIALLLRNSSSNGNATKAENKNRAANTDSKGNASNTVNDNVGSASYNSANRANGNAANRNDSATMSSAERAEAKVVRGATLEEADLSSLSAGELRRLRNAVYARHGRTFDSADLQRYFDGRPWYRPRSDYSEAALTAQD
ncbi:MAG: YARHG domain-containing protein, partial [Acidobacteria bacterium]|nr:YARHG domain-containing protein [Acidobacteriota bacterium]